MAAKMSAWRNEHAEQTLRHMDKMSDEDAKQLHATIESMVLLHSIRRMLYVFMIVLLSWIVLSVIGILFLLSADPQPTTPLYY